MSSPQPQRRRVVITGMGVIAPNGCDLPEFWRTISSGISAAGPVTRFATDQFPCRIAAEIRDFDPAKFMDRRTVKRTDLATQYSIAAARQALGDSRLVMAKADPERFGIIEGAGTRGLQSYYNCNLDYWKKGYRGLNPFDVINSYNGEGVGKVALELGIRGHALTISSGSASSNDAIGYALDLVRNDDADVVLAGGTDEAIVEPIYAGFNFLHLLASTAGDPSGAMRPYDKSRNGFLFGEGSAWLVLEELTHALSRGARIYCELLGHGRACEAFHPVNPHPDGYGVAGAIRRALRDAALDPADIDYINSHGTATVLGDPAETRGIKQAFDGQPPPVSSTKPVTGHWFGGAGAVETVVCALAFEHQTMPATLNLASPDPECDLDYVSSISRRQRILKALNLNIGFGGKNSCLVLSKFQGADTAKP